LPGARGRKAWTIEESPEGTGAVDLKAGLMRVPLGANPYDFCVRAHELGHAMWSSGRPGTIAKRLGVDVKIYQVVEDNRIQGWLDRVAGVDLSAGCVPDAECRSAAERAVALRAYRVACMLQVAVGHTGSEPTVRRALTFSGDPEAQRAAALADEAARQLWATDRPSQRRTGVVALWLQAQFDALGWPAPDGDAADVLGRVVGPPGPGSGPAGESDDGDDGEGTADGALTWGCMEVVVPPLTRTGGRRRFGSRWSASEEGSDPRHIHRILTDGRVFARRVAAPGGAVLIDASGSMSLPAEAIRRIVERAPGATVAAYAGHANVGILKILARRGRIAHPDDCSLRDAGNGNVVDGPALRWLARQSAPRLWVSDGRVTGCDDVPTAGNQRDAQRICTRARIHRVDTVDAALEALERRGRPSHGRG
jgi:hypothetical protein